MLASFICLHDTNTRKYTSKTILNIALRIFHEESNTGYGNTELMGEDVVWQLDNKEDKSAHATCKIKRILGAEKITSVMNTSVSQAWC